MKEKLMRLRAREAMLMARDPIENAGILRKIRRRIRILEKNQL